MRARLFRTELRELFRLAMPLAAAQAGTQLMGLVDVAVLGRLGAQELAGSGLATAVFFAASVFGMGMMLGIDPLVAQAVGAGDRIRARRVIANIFSFVLDLVFVFGVHGWIPAMGVAGAALSTVICTFIELGIVGAALPPRWRISSPTSLRSSPPRSP